MSATGNGDGREKARFDFAFLPVQDNPERQVYAVPHPRRYDRLMHNGRLHLLDRYLRTLVSFEDVSRDLQSLPMFRSPRTIQSAPEYASRRRQAVERELDTGDYIAPDENPKAHEPFADGIRDVAFLSVDICGATARRAKDPDGFDTAFHIFMREIGTLVGQFHGTLLKTKGDGFVAYIDLPSFTVEADAAVDLGLSILLMVDQTLNPALQRLGQEPMAVRVGADYGPAELKNVWIAATNFSQSDLVSDALNRATKIEESCCPGEFRIGRALYELIHVEWLERCSSADFDTNVGISDYRVYSVI